jgi:hypothetical protein
MITQWPTLGIVEPVEPPPGFEGTFHVEMTPTDPPAEDPTAALLAAVERLAEVGREAEPEPEAVSARKRFKPPRIHRRRGDV